MQRTVRYTSASKSAPAVVRQLIRELGDLGDETSAAPVCGAPGD